MDEKRPRRKIEIVELVPTPEELTAAQSETVQGGSLQTYFAKVQGEKQGSTAPGELTTDSPSGVR